MVFFGTPLFAVPALTDLIKRGYKIVRVVTAPPKPIGRHSTPIKSLIQILAERHNLPVSTPSNITDQKFLDELKNLKPRIAVIAAYGKILPAELLRIPASGFVNIHPSLLPRHRGPAPIVHTILAGDKKMGVSLIVLDNQMDHGPLIAQQSWPVPSDATTLKLTEVLAHKGANLLIKTLPNYLSGKTKPLKQDESRATTHHLLKRQDGEIDWQKSATSIERMSRAYSPWPGTYSCLGAKRIKIFNLSLKSWDSLRKSGGSLSDQQNQYTNKKVGQIIVNHHKLFISAKDGLLDVQYLQLAGQKKLSAKDFINGHPGLDGTLLSGCPNKERAATHT